ncbi:MAG: O-antigen ligase family protein, partial [Lachnospiraceae bacterium]|nr:O-antigen ligase family protein [Lachnospiraceae bacterium]
VEIWREHPLLGIGMDNARMIGGEVFNKGEYYLHNNYMELLADGGLIGFLLYYSMPFLLLTRAVRQQRRWVEDDAMICVILLLLMLVLDVGFVSYDSRTNYLLYLAIYIEFRNKHTDKDKILRESGDLT